MNIFSYKKKSDIFEIIGLKIDSILEQNLTEINATPNYKDYGIFFKDNFDVFNYAIFKIFGGKKDLSGESSINLILGAAGRDISIDKIINLVNILFNEFGFDKSGNGKIIDSEIDSLSSFWIGREWLLDINFNEQKEFNADSFMLSVYLHSEQNIQLTIMGANKLFI
jgi:hypothetical protein